MKKFLSAVCLWVLALFLVAPFVWMVLISLHGPKEAIPPLVETVPKVWHPENYTFVLFNPSLPVSRFFWNSVFVTFSIVFLQLFVTSMAAYAFARLTFKGKETLFAMFLGSMMFAGSVLQIPVYLLIKGFGWLDSYQALIIPAVSSSFTVFLLRQFMISIPRELDEAAKLDGATEFQIYSRVILPLSKASLATAGAFTFFGVWTDFFGPLIYTNSTEMRTLEVGLSVFKNSYGATAWPLQMTAAVIVMIPLIVVFLFSQRFFIKGVLMGSQK
jgi:multiple sugar transport system permease protein